MQVYMSFILIKWYATQVKVMTFNRGFHNIKYHQFSWHDKEREWWSFIGCGESFITIKPIWHNYLVFSLDNYAHETPTEIGLMNKEKNKISWWWNLAYTITKNHETIMKLHREDLSQLHTFFSFYWSQGTLIININQ